MGSTKTGAGDDADNFDVMDNGILGLLGGVGGEYSILAAGKASKAAAAIEEIKGAAENGADALGGGSTIPEDVVIRKKRGARWQYSNEDGGVTEGPHLDTIRKKASDSKIPDTVIITRVYPTPNPSKKKKN